MTHAPTSTVILAVPGGQETQELPVDAVREALARGEIEPTRWAWCRNNKEWKPITELPEFRVESAPQPVPVPVPVVMKSPVAKVTAPSAKSQPVLVQAPAAVPPRPTRRSDYKVREQGGFGYFKLFVILLAVAILAVTGVNYFKVDEPLNANLIKTNYATTPVHAHLGAFFQPNTVVIHLMKASNIKSGNLADYLTTLAASTPKSPLGNQAFATIGLTSAWTSQVMITGEDWQTLAGMGNSTADEKETFLLTHLGYPTGERLLGDGHNMDPDRYARNREKAWHNLCALLLPNSN